MFTNMIKDTELMKVYSTAVDYFSSTIAVRNTLDLSQKHQRFHKRYMTNICGVTNNVVIGYDYNKDNSRVTIVKTIASAHSVYEYSMYICKKDGRWSGCIGLTDKPCSYLKREEAYEIIKYLMYHIDIEDFDITEINLSDV